MIGLDLDALSVDGSITKSPCGGQVAGRSPVDRGKQDTKRSVACDNQVIPLHCVDRDPALDQPCAQCLPLASQTHHPSTPLTINCRTL
jgi:hypothetical protein